MQALSSSGAKFAGCFVGSSSGTGSSIAVYSAASSYDFYAAATGITYGSSSSRRWKRNVEDIADALGLDYSRLTPLLVQAVNELAEENRRLRAELASLDARLDALE